MTPVSSQQPSAPAVRSGSLVALACSNALVLRQGIALISRLEPQQFALPPQTSGLPEAARDLFARGAVGAHFRHVLEHFESFLDALDSECINYDQRARDRRVETQRELACERMEACARALEGLGSRESDRSLGVLVGAPGDGLRNGRSSLARELQFLASHTVHHYALIAVLVRLWGVVPDDEFGVAPSTLAFERGTQPCAR